MAIGVLDDVLEAEGAVAGQPFALAPAAQILPVGSFGIDMAQSRRTRTSCLVADLELRSMVSGGSRAFHHVGRLKCLTWHVMSSTRYGLNSFWHFLQNCLK